MYSPNQFQVENTAEILSFIETHNFGQLISLTEGRLFASHLPFQLDGSKQKLICHLAKANPQWKDIENQEVLITFEGPHDYISPSWYTSPGVPTWNYQAVHVYGTPKLITEKTHLKQLVEALTHQHEQSVEQPWQPEYKDTLLNAIIGLEITITELQGKYKLSQNRSQEDQQKIADTLQKNGNNALAKSMEQQNTKE